MERGGMYPMTVSREKRRRPRGLEGRGHGPEKVIFESI